MVMVMVLGTIGPGEPGEAYQHSLFSGHLAY